MDYQEIITAYKKKKLDTTSLEKDLAVAMNLSGRKRYRAIDIINNSLEQNNKIIYLLTMSENKENAHKFLDTLDIVLNNCFASLIGSIKSCNAWTIIGLLPKGCSQAEFQTLTIPNKFKILFSINKKYLKFLNYQKLADIRELNPQQRIMDLEFLILMFDALKSQVVKDEFFCFDKNFLITLVNFRRSKKLRLEDFVKNKNKSIQDDYKNYSVYFSTKDFRDIAENLSLTSRNLNVSLTRVIEVFWELSESETEKSHIEKDYKDLKDLQRKYIKFSKLQEKKALKKDLEESSEFYKNDDFDSLENDPVCPLILTWFEKEDVSLTRKLSNKKLTEFFEKIKDIELTTGNRVSLFLVSNASKEVTAKRLLELQKKALENDLPQLIEAGFGGYSTFKIDLSGNVTNIAEMSDLNRNKIITLLEKPDKYFLPKELVDENEKSYLRYQFSNTNKKNITVQYLKSVIDQLLKEDSIRKQPIRFLPYTEKNSIGIDVVLESQLKGIVQIPEYYKVKYNCVSGKTLKVDVTNIDNFLDEELVVKTF